MKSQRTNPLMSRSSPYNHWIVLAVIMLVAFALRAYNLGLIPLNHDERWLAVESVDIIKEGGTEKVFNIPISFYAGKEIILFYLFTFLSSHFFIDPAIAVRVPSVIFGVLTVFFTYLIASKMYNSKKTGLLSALFLAFLPWHIIMSRIGSKVIMPPLFGIVIFYLLYAGVKDKKIKFLLTSFFMLGIGSFYVYPNAWSFVPIFLLSFIVLRIMNDWPGKKTICMGLLFFFISLFPLLVLMFKVNFLNNQSYHSVFKSLSLSSPDFCSLFLNNFIYNLKTSFILFFFPDFSSIGLFAPTMVAPLMISPAFFPLFLVSILYAAWKRSEADVIMLIWLLLTLIGPSLASKAGIGARYLLIILPVPLALTARLLADLYSYPLRSKVLKIMALAISFAIVICSTGVIAKYYAEAADNKDEWLMNSFGSREAARYLFEDNLKRDYVVITDFRMAIAPYLIYYTKIFNNKKEIFGKPSEHFSSYDANKFGALYFPEAGGSVKDILELERRLLEENNVIYYFLWSPETHLDSEDSFLKRFCRLSRVFNECHPQAKPVKEILYPDNSVAIEVFKIYR